MTQGSLEMLKRVDEHVEKRAVRSGAGPARYAGDVGRRASPEEMP